MNAVIFGGGNIGRGLIAPVLAAGGYSITVVDANQQLIQDLADQGSYDVLHTDGASERVSIAKAVTAQDQDAVVAAVAQADLIATAVGGAILPIVAPPIREGLNRNDQPTVNVIACENTHPNSQLLHEAIGSELARDAVGFPEVVVDRIVIPAEGLNVSVEAGFEFFVDGTEWVGEPPPDGIVLVDDVDAYLTRKLWLVNGLHAAVAFQGIQRKYGFIHEAIADPVIANDVAVMASNMVQVLNNRYPQMTRGHLEATAAASLHRFADSSIEDALTRVARNPLLKLAKDERLLGPALAAAKAGLVIEPHARAISAALDLPAHAEIVGRSELQEALASGGWQAFLEQESLKPGDPLWLAIAEQLEKEGDTVNTIVESITILNPSGLHARPASAIVEHMKSTDASVTIQKGEKVADAGSILSVLTLGASTGDEVTVTGEGEGAQEAVAFVKEVLLSEEGE